MAAAEQDTEDEPYGWVMVFCAAMLIALSFGSLGTIGVFLKPLSAEFGWGRGATAFGYTSISISAAIFGPIFGYLADKYGSRRFAFPALIVMALSMFLLSRVETLWQFYASYLLFGALGFAAVGGPLIANVGFWFNKRPGLAIGLTAAGGALGQAVLPFVSRLLISAYDVQTAYLCLAGVYLFIGFPLCFLIRESPRRMAALNNKIPEAVTRAQYPLPAKETIAWLSVAVIFCCTCMAVPIVHSVAMASDRGHAPETAASILAVLMTAGIAGRILGGRLADLIGVLPTYMLSSISQAFLALWFPFVDSLFGIYVLAALFGVAYSGVMASFVICIRMMVPPGVSARGTGIVSAFGMLGMGFGSYFGGLMFDWTGTYIWSFVGATSAGLINFVILTLLYLKIRGHRGPDQLAASAA